MVGDTVLISDDGASFLRFPSSFSSECFDTDIQQRIASSVVSENETAGSSFMGKPLDMHNFYQRLLKFSWNEGDHQQGPDMSQCLSDGSAMLY